MWRGKVDIGMCGSAGFAVGVDGSGEFSKVGGGPGKDGDNEQEEPESKEDDATANISAFPFIV